MRYYLNLFSPETAKAFSESQMNITGFQKSRKSYIDNQNINTKDIFICYCTKIKRFIGAFEILSKPFLDDTPLFVDKDDPFILRIKVKPIVWLPLEHGIPLEIDMIWNNLSFTKDLNKDSSKWTYMVFQSPRLWPENDGEYLLKVLKEQERDLVTYPFSDKDLLKLKSSKIRISNNKEVVISIPDDEENRLESKVKRTNKIIRDSIRIQAKLAEIGEKLGYRIWLPTSDRSRVLELWNAKEESLLEELPLVFDDTTLKTIRNIDVLWIQRRSIVRCFEVEDTTSIYSGILRMADLLSLQPMLDIKIHIVAPDDRRESVFQQINRPVFAVMEKGPLAELCSFISYDNIDELMKEKRLEYMTDQILDEYSENSLLE